MEERLHKYLARCGVASRRKCEELIAEGRVVVDGEVVTEMGVKIDPDRAKIKVDGRPLRPEKKVYYVLHKPRDCTTSAEDELGRRTVLDLLTGVKERVYPVGRLDRDSEGLLVLTNDGDLAFYLTHPACGVLKTYWATVEGQVSAETLRGLVEKGIRLGPVLVKAHSARLVRADQNRSRVEVTVGEGVNREIRRLFAALGHEVKRLIRVRVGPLVLKGLGRSKFRQLTAKELSALQKGMKKADAARLRAAEEGEVPARRRRPGPRGPRLGKPDPAAPRQREERAPARPLKPTPETPKKAAAHPLFKPKSKNSPKA